MTTSKSKKVLISGASIAGPVAGYYLSRYGFDVTVVERASGVRSGGYPIDVRGPALGVIEQMGILDLVRDAQVIRGKTTFLSPSGRVAGSLPAETLFGNMASRDVELPRGRLTDLIFEVTKHVLAYRFNEEIKALEDDGQGVDVSFTSGIKERFDIVIVAEGIHSKTREMVFGSEDEFSSYLGLFFSLFTFPGEFCPLYETVAFNAPGRLAWIMAPAPNVTQALLVAKRYPQTRAPQTPDDVRAFFDSTFLKRPWRMTEVLAQLERSTDIYSDVMMQIRMPSWSSGNIVVTGDAAYAPSFFSGQGTSIALIGAYVLAGELAAHADTREGARAYEQTCRRFVEVNQDLAFEGRAVMTPDTSFKLAMRNFMMRLAPLLTKVGVMKPTGHGIYTAMDLPEYNISNPSNY